MYATAALVGSAVLVMARRLGLVALLGGAACFALRMVAIWQHWQLPGAVASG